MNWKAFLTTMGAVAATLVLYELVKEPAKSAVKSLVGKDESAGEKKE